MFDTDIHLSITLLNEYFLAILQYFLEHLAFGTFIPAFRSADLKYHKNQKRNITFIEGVYIRICNDNYKLMQFIFFLFFERKLIDNFPIMKSYFRYIGLNRG